MKSPLLIGCDVRDMSNATVEILQNRDIIAVNQDPLGIQGHRVWNDEKKHEIWAGKLIKDRTAVILFNRDGENGDNITLDFNMIGLTPGTTAEIYDLWQHKSLGTYYGSFVGKNIPKHGNIMIGVTPVL